MIKRYAIFSGHTVKRIQCRGKDTPIFEVEREAVEYGENSITDMFVVLPIYVSKEISQQQTYKPSSTKLPSIPLNSIYRNKNTGIIVRKCFDREDGVVLALDCYWQIKSVEEKSHYLKTVPYATIEEIEDDSDWELLK